MGVALLACASTAPVELDMLSGTWVKVTDLRFRFEFGERSGCALGCVSGAAVAGAADTAGTKLGGSVAVGW